MPSTPAIEPGTATAGDTLAWSRSLPDYPATLWTLKYALQTGSSDPIVIAATASGNDFAVNVPAATSAAYAPGVYGWTAYVEGSGERHTVARGTLTILPSPLVAAPESHAAKMLRLIRAALEGRIPNGLESTDIDGQRIDLIKHSDLLRLESWYSARVAAEQNRLSIASGGRNRRNSFARFVPVR